MWKTALLLLVTIIIIPSIAFAIDTPLNPAQQAILNDLLWVYVIAVSLCFIISSSGNSRKRKEDCLEAGEPLPDKYSKGFIDSGLWGIVRHPNYASEQSIWIVFYLFSVSATGLWLNWSLTGALLLVLLFYGSSNFSESISMSKYPEYADYKEKIPRFIPIKLRGLGG